MVTQESESAKKLFETMANGISGSPLVGARRKTAKKYIFLLRSLP